MFFHKLLPPHTAHFDDNIGPPSLAFNTFESTLSVSFCNLNNKSSCFVMIISSFLFLKIWFLMIAVKTPWFFSNHFVSHCYFGCVNTICKFSTTKTLSFVVLFCSFFFFCNMFYTWSSIFLTINFNQLDFVEWFCFVFY